MLAKYVYTYLYTDIYFEHVINLHVIFFIYLFFLIKIFESISVVKPVPKSSPPPFFSFTANDSCYAILCVLIIEKRNYLQNKYIIYILTIVI